MKTKRYLSKSQVDRRITGRNLMAISGQSYVVFSVETKAERKRWKDSVALSGKPYTITMRGVCYCYTSDFRRALAEFMKCIRAMRAAEMEG